MCVVLGLYIIGVRFSFLSFVISFLGASCVGFGAFLKKMIFFLEIDAKKSSRMFEYNVFCYLCASLTL